MATQNRSILQKAFMTSDRRLNLFWRVLFYIFGFFLLDVIGSELGSVVAQLLRWPADTVGQTLSVLFIVPLLLGFTYFFRLRVDRRSWRGMALTPLNRAPLHLLLGILVGCVMLGLIFILEYALGWIRVAGTELDSSGMLVSLGLVLAGPGLVFAAATGFVEELGFRGYLFQNLGRTLPLWLAILITGVLFGLLHFTQPGFGVVLIAQAVVVTMFLVFCRLSTGTLWLAIGWHAGWNWMEDSVIGFSSANTPSYGHALLHLKLLQPDSLVQPELGWVGLIVQLLAIAALWLWMQRGKWQPRLQARLNDEGQVQARLDPTVMRS